MTHHHPTAVAAGGAPEVRGHLHLSFDDAKCGPLRPVGITTAAGRRRDGTADVLGAQQWTRESAVRRSAAEPWPWGVEGIIKAAAGRSRGVQGMITAPAAVSGEPLRPEFPTAKPHGTLTNEVNAGLSNGLSSGEIAVTGLIKGRRRRRVFLDAVFARAHRIGRKTTAGRLEKMGSA